MPILTLIPNGPVSFRSNGKTWTSKTPRHEVSDEEAQRLLSKYSRFLAAVPGPQPKAPEAKPAEASKAEVQQPQPKAPEAKPADASKPELAPQAGKAQRPEKATEAPAAGDETNHPEDALFEA
jgi:hypothetical protein